MGHAKRTLAMQNLLRRACPWHRYLIDMQTYVVLGRDVEGCGEVGHGGGGVGGGVCRVR